MLIRQYQEKDLAALRAIHAAQGFEYALPDLSNPLFVTKLVLARDADEPPTVGARYIVPLQTPGSEDATRPAPPERAPDDPAKDAATGREGNDDAPQRGNILGAAFLRLTAEAYLLLDPRAGTPRERWQWLLALHAAAERDAWQRGLEDVHAWLPPPIAKKFGKRIARLGWLRDDVWTPYCRRLPERL